MFALNATEEALKTPPTAKKQAEQALAILEKEQHLAIQEIAARVPTTPQETLRSRRHTNYPNKELQMRGDFIGFVLDTESTNPEFMATVRLAQQSIKNIFETDLKLEGKRPFWNHNKEKRREEKPYKIQKNPHLTFSGSIPPCALKDYMRIQQQRLITSPNWSASIEKILQSYINTNPTGTVKECKLNPDGHVVVRITISNSAELLKCKDALSAAFGINNTPGAYIRHTDPEKQTTLAAVIAVIDLNKLSIQAQEALQKSVLQLDIKLKLFSKISLKTIAWGEYANCRTLSNNSLIRKSLYASMSTTPSITPK
ncbi:MAG: hypothetical protein WCW01_05205 [Gammaproteobacteria bacterium]